MRAEEGKKGRNRGGGIIEIADVVAAAVADGDDAAAPLLLHDAAAVDAIARRASRDVTKEPQREDEERRERSASPARASFSSEEIQKSGRERKREPLVLKFSHFHDKINAPLDKPSASDPSDASASSEPIDEPP